MTRPAAAWLGGTVAFFLPLMITALGVAIDLSTARHHPIHVASVPVAVILAVALAAVVPSVIVLRNGRPLASRIALIVGVLVLLAVECAASVWYALSAGC